MPYYYFDLVVGEEFKNQGGIILEDIEVASDRAHQLANELSQVKPELQQKGCAVRVTDRDHKRALSHAARSRAGLAALGYSSTGASNQFVSDNPPSTTKAAPVT
ncbi:Holliday junction resolvasome RuvABC DNA-binding subunit [Bradyrhizobium diazoefficiens]